MQKEHRDIIQKNFSSLVEQTDLDMMVANLYEKGVFSEAMIEVYKDTNKDVRSRKRLLYRDITRRGPDAFRHLTDTLMELGYWDLVRILDPSKLKTAPRPEYGGQTYSIKKNKKTTGKEQKDPQCHSSSSNATEYNGIESRPPKVDNHATLKEREIPQFNVIKSTKFYEEDEADDIKLYRTRGRNRGVLVLFTYIEYASNMEEYRSGADVDADKLKYLFTELGLKVLGYKNLTLTQTKETLSKLQEVVCSGSPETVFIMFSSHGYERPGTMDNDIRCSDGGLISLYEIIAYFNNDRFPELCGVPKVFIFQNCRGTNDARSIDPLREPNGRAARWDGETGESERRGSGDNAESERRGSGESTGSQRHHCWDGAKPLTGHPPPDQADATGDVKDRLYSDILIAHSTVPGSVSHRDPEKGSWYVHSLCEVFANRAHNTHVADLFTLVDKHMHRTRNLQTSSIDRWGFNKRLYLHPGLYED